MLLYFFQSAFGARITGECIWTLEDCQMQGFLQLAATLCPLACLLYLFEYATFTPPSLFHLFFFFSPCHFAIEAVMSLNYCCVSLSFLHQSFHLGQREELRGHSLAVLKVEARRR